MLIYKNTFFCYNKTCFVTMEKGWEPPRRNPVQNISLAILMYRRCWINKLCIGWRLIRVLSRPSTNKFFSLHNFEMFLVVNFMKCKKSTTFILNTLSVKYVLYYKFSRWDFKIVKLNFQSVFKAILMNICS